MVASKIEEEWLEVADGFANDTADDNVSVAASEVKVKGLEVADGPADMIANKEVSLMAVGDALAEVWVLAAVESADIS